MTLSLIPIGFFKFLLLLASVGLERASCTDLFFIGTTTSLATNPPSSLSASGLSASLASLVSCPAPFKVEKQVSDRVKDLISSDFLNRPGTVWAVSLAGVSASDPEALQRIRDWNLGAGKVQNGPIHLEGGQNVKDVVGAVSTVVSAIRGGSKVGNLWGRASAGCEDECLERGLIEVAGDLYKPAEQPLEGVFVGRNGNGKGVDLQLGSPAVRAWVQELVGVWSTTKRMSLSGKSIPAFLDTTLMGLQLVRGVHAPDSEAFGVAVEITWGLLGMVHETLEEDAEDEVVTQVSLLGDVNSAGSLDELVATIQSQKRRSLKAAKVSKTKTVEEKRKSFFTLSAAYGITLFMFFSLLLGVYAMASMDFSSNTLLFSQSKVD